MPKAEYFTQPQPDLWVLQGEMDFVTVMPVLRAFKKLLGASQVQQLELSLARVEKAQTVVLSLLLEMQRMANKKNIQIYFSSIPQNVKGIAKLNGVDAFVWGNKE